MSTKIYNGYVLPPMSFYDLQRFINKLREKLIPIKDKLILEAVARQVVSNFDDLVFSNLTEDNWFYRFAEARAKVDGQFTDGYKKNILDNSLMYSVREKVSRSFETIYKTNRRDPEYDFQFSASFIGGKNKTYVTIYCERKEYEQVWESMKGVTPYPYWDNTDHPEELTYREWRARGREWDKVLIGNNGPGLIGLNFNLMDEKHLSLFGIDYSEVIGAMSSVDKRAKKIARQIAENEVYVRIKKEFPEKYEHGYAAFFEAARFDSGTKEGIDLFNKYYDEYLPKISEITPEILKMNFKMLKENYGTTSVK